MAECADMYVQYVMEQLAVAKEKCKDPIVLIEQHLDFSKWVPQGFGTGDCVIVSDGLLHIIDYKHGLGVLVSAEKNSQLSCYALGASTCSMASTISLRSALPSTNPPGECQQHTP